MATNSSKSASTSTNTGAGEGDAHDHLPATLLQSPPRHSGDRKRPFEGDAIGVDESEMDFSMEDLAACEKVCVASCKNLSLFPCDLARRFVSWVAKSIFVFVHMIMLCQNRPFPHCLYQFFPSVPPSINAYANTTL